MSYAGKNNMIEKFECIDGSIIEVDIGEDCVPCLHYQIETISMIDEHGPVGQCTKCHKKFTYSEVMYHIRYLEYIEGIKCT